VPRHAHMHTEWISLTWIIYLHNILYKNTLTKYSLCTMYIHSMIWNCIYQDKFTEYFVHKQPQFTEDDGVPQNRPRSHMMMVHTVTWQEDLLIGHLITWPLSSIMQSANSGNITNLSTEHLNFIILHSHVPLYPQKASNLMACSFVIYLPAFFSLYAAATLVVTRSRSPVWPSTANVTSCAKYLEFTRLIIEFAVLV